MSQCFLHGHGQCGGKITGEHYISKTVLDAIGGGGSVQIGGLPWQQPQTLQRIGIASLVANALCEKHNSALSSLDSVAGELFRALDAVDKQPTTLPSVVNVDGALVERWFLKVICGLVAGVGLNTGTVPVKWLDLLSGESWPTGWGLCVPTRTGSQVFAKEFYVETRVKSGSSEIGAVMFRVAGVHFNLLFGVPADPVAWGIHRPRGLIFLDGTTEKRIELAWPFDTEQAVIYTKVGTTKVPPLHSDWKT